MYHEWLRRCAILGKSVLTSFTIRDVQRDGLEPFEDALRRWDSFGRRKWWKRERWRWSGVGEGPVDPEVSKDRV